MTLLNVKTDYRHVFTTPAIQRTGLTHLFIGRFPVEDRRCYRSIPALFRDRYAFALKKSQLMQPMRQARQ